MPAADRGHETVLDPGVRDGRALYPRRNHAARPGDGEPNDDDAAFEIALARKALLIAVPGLADMTAGGATNDLLVDRPADFRLTDDDVWNLVSAIAARPSPGQVVRMRTGSCAAASFSW